MGLEEISVHPGLCYICRSPRDILSIKITASSTKRVGVATSAEEPARASGRMGRGLESSTGLMETEVYLRKSEGAIQDIEALEAFDVSKKQGGTKNHETRRKTTGTDCP